jgi:hypothetical protein
MLGPHKHRTGLICNVSFEHKPFKCLGVHVGHNKTECEKLNWDAKISAIERLLVGWKKRNLTIFGKITIIKALAISKITHVAQNTVVPEKAIKEINKILFAFIWGKKDRIRRKILCNNVNDGGVGMIDLKSFFEALKATWINRLMRNKHENWAFIGYQNIFKHIGSPDLLVNMNFDANSSFPSFKKLPAFYQETFLAFTHSRPSMNIQNIPDRDELLNQPIWGNTLFMPRGRHHCTLHFPTWIESGLLYVKDFKFVNGEVDERFIYNKLTSRANFFGEMYKIKSVLRPFKAVINDYEPLENIIDENDTQTNITCIVKSKQYYADLTKKNLERPQSENKWRTVLQGHNIELEFKDIYTRKVINIKERKLAEFNYKILHLILVCNSNLYKWGKCNTDKCEVCNLKEDIVHLLFLCPHAQYIWNFVSQTLEIDLTEIDIVCGREKNDPLNYCITLIAYIIYKEWLICKDMIINRRVFNRKHFFYSELCFRVAVCKKLEMNTTCIVEMVTKLIDNIHHIM